MHEFIAVEEEMFDDICWPAVPYNWTAESNEINKMHPGVMILIWLFPYACPPALICSNLPLYMIHFLYVLLTII